MLENWRDTSLCRVATAAIAAGSIAVCLVLLAGPVVAQQPLPGAPYADPPVVEPPANPSYRPGFLDTLNRWLGDSKAALDEQFKRSQERLGAIGKEATGAAQGAVGAAQEAAGAVVALPAARIVNGRQTCAVAPNGAPDCQPAVDALCRSRGFHTGKSLEIASAHKCASRVWMYGTAAEKAACPVETAVTRAFCQ